jgi:ribosomal protein S18 acetylase RimI-like enzyme
VNLVVRHARPEERTEALRLYFQRVAADERDARVERALDLIARGELTAEGVIVCHQGSGLVGVMVGMPLTGAAGLVWPPQAAQGPVRVPVEDALLDFASAWLQRRGCRFAQALMAPEDMESAESLERRGFSRITTLQYLEKELGGTIPPTATALQFQGFPLCNRDLFEMTLEQTYQNTMDCPELNEVRTPGEVIDGYLKVAGCRPDCWWLALYGDNVAGLLITTPIQNTTSWELLYVGLVPQARGRGLGTHLVNQAMHTALEQGATRLTLTVDFRNAPALRMYERLEFQEFDRREVYLRIF